MGLKTMQLLLMQSRRGCVLSYLAPLRYPRAVGDRVVAEQGRGLGPDQLADLAEHQPDLLLCAWIGARLDGVPQRPDVRRPQQAGRHPVRREPAHERGLVLLLVERDALLVQPEVPGHPALELLHLLQQRGRPLHQLGVRQRPFREPERDIGSRTNRSDSCETAVPGRWRTSSWVRILEQLCRTKLKLTCSS